MAGRATRYDRTRLASLHQLFSDGFDPAMVVTVPSLGGTAVSPTTVGAGGLTAFSTLSDGALVVSGQTWYVLAGGRAFGIPTQRPTDPTKHLRPGRPSRSHPQAHGSFTPCSSCVTRGGRSAGAPGAGASEAGAREAGTRCRGSGGETKLGEHHPVGLVLHEQSTTAAGRKKAEGCPACLPAVELRSQPFG